MIPVVEAPLSAKRISLGRLLYAIGLVVGASAYYLLLLQRDAKPPEEPWLLDLRDALVIWTAILVTLRMRNIGYNIAYGLIPIVGYYSIKYDFTEPQWIHTTFQVAQVPILLWNLWIGITCLAFPANWKSHRQADRAGSAIMRGTQLCFFVLILAILILYVTTRVLAA